MTLRECGTCAYWRAGAFPNTDFPAPADSQALNGVCENIVPQIYIVNGIPETLQPMTHATRCCAEWRSVWFDDGPDDDPDGGEPKPAPDLSRVRALFPVQPIAA